MPMINTNKTDNDVYVKNKTEQSIQSKEIEEKERYIIEICNKLFFSTVDFKTQEVYDQIRDYINKYERFLYSTISNYIFHEVKDEKGLSIVNVNIGVLFQYLDMQQKDNKVSKDEYEKMKKVLLKIYDHVNLANRQFVELKESDDEFKKKMQNYMAPYQEKISKEMSMQLLTMVSIFTALAFLMFGGMSSLGSIFSNHELPVLKVIIIGCVWGLCTLNIIFVFLFCVGKMTKIDFASTSKKDSNIIHKYFVVWWSDLIIITVLAGSLWTYFVRENKLDSGFNLICHKYSTLTMIAGYALIIFIFLVLVKYLFDQRKK